MFVIGDIHGEIDLLKDLYKHIKTYNEPIFSVGDIIDRGPDPVGCLNFAFENGIVPVMGNHELMFLEATNKNDIYRKDSIRLWLRNGGYVTDEQISNMPKKEYEELRERVNRLPYFIITSDKDKKIVITHAGMTRHKDKDFFDDLYEESNDLNFLWHRDDYIMSSEFKNLKDVYIVTGHTPMIEIAFDRHNRFIVDTGAFRFGRLSAIRFHNGNIEEHWVLRETGYGFRVIKE